MSKKKSIRSFSKEDLKEEMLEIGQPAFRSTQIWEWLWEKGASSFDEMTNLPKELRGALSEHFTLDKVKVKTTQYSSDGTIKFAFELFDGETVEGVLIPSGKRLTACISSQVGCSLSCKFCATGLLQRKRNLMAHEIYDQAFLINQECQRYYKQKLSNIVYMGMGEPLLNFKNVVYSIDRITSENGLGMSPKRITVSTVGIAKMTRRLADECPKVNFAFSIHAAMEDKRKQIMPITEQNDLADMADAIQYFHQKTGTRITYEYTLLKGVNDQYEDAVALAEFAKITPCKINLIEYNPVEGTGFEKSGIQATRDFKSFLEGKNLIVNIRRSRGKDIDAACGQLANKSVA